MTTRFKVGILGAGFNSGNLGVSALTVGALSCILHEFPTAEIILLNYEKAGSSFSVDANGTKANIRVVNMRFSKRIYLSNNITTLLILAVLFRLIPVESVRRRILELNACLKEIATCDLIGSVAGGDSFSDIYGMGRLIYVALPQILVLLMSKRLVLFPQTLGPFSRGIARRIARYILSRAEITYSRDRHGVTGALPMARNTDDGNKPRFCYDMAVLVDPVRPAKLDIEGISLEKVSGLPLVGINPSGLLFMGGYTGGNMFGLTVKYEELVYRIVELMIRNKNARVLLVPHVFGNSAESDLAVCCRIYESLKEKYAGRIGVARGEYNQSEVKYIIGKCEFFIGSRMHACIAAVSQCVPAISIAYSDKFAGVMETLGVGELVADPRKMQCEEILRVIDEAYNQRDSYQQTLSAAMPGVKATVRSLLRGLHEPSCA